MPVTIETHVNYNNSELYESENNNSDAAAFYAVAGCSNDLNNFSITKDTAQLMHLSSIEEYDSDDTIINNQSHQYINHKVFSICDRVINHNRLLDNNKISNQFDSDYDKLIVG